MIDDTIKLAHSVPMALALVRALMATHIHSRTNTPTETVVLCGCLTVAVYLSFFLFYYLSFFLFTFFVCACVCVHRVDMQQPFVESVYSGRSTPLEFTQTQTDRERVGSLALPSVH